MKSNSNKTITKPKYEVNQTLPDVLKKGLSVVFCGTAVGNRSANISAYYAGRGNKFWKVLFEVGLTPVLLEPEQYMELLKYGIGLTDLAKFASGNDSELTDKDFDVVSLQGRIIYYKPKIIAFNGKKAAKIFLDKEDIDYGPYKEKKIRQTAIYILPSTSGSANRYWDISYWYDLKNFLIQVE